MADSWEDLDSQPQAQSSGQPAQRKPPAGGLNPNANSFSFNPTANSFTPSFAAAPKPKPPAPTFAAQPVEQQAAPASSQPAHSNADHQTTNADHTSTNGAQATAAEPPVDPPSERDTPVTTASAPSEETERQNDAKSAPSAGVTPCSASRIEGSIDTIDSNDSYLLAEPSVESITADVAELKVKEPPASKAAPEPSTSAPHKHDEHDDPEETEEDRAKREAELKKIYADLAKEDDRHV